MSGPGAASGEGAALRRRRRPLRLVAGDGAFLGGVLLLGALSWWRVSQSGWGALALAIALAAGAGVAFAGYARRWSAWRVTLLVAAFYLVTALPVAAPTMLADPRSLLAGALGIVTAPVTGWMNLLTLEVPVGAYQAVLAPIYALVLAVSTLALSLAWRSPHAWGAAAPVALVLLASGIAFGSSATAGSPGSWPWFEIALGVGAALLSAGWFVWRAREARRAALASARRAGGARVTARSRRTLGARAGLAAGMVAIAVAAGAALAPWALASSTRDVLRTGVDPSVTVRAAMTPLTDYRLAFGDDRYDAVLFRIAAPEGVERVRLASLSEFDGRVMRVGADEGAPFVRVPAARGGTADARVRVSIETYEGPWVPTVGELEAIAFEGEERAALSDGFYYDPAGATGIVVTEPGLRSGTTYTLEAEASVPDVDPSGLEPGRPGPSYPEEVVPESLRAWIDAQDAPAGGAGLVVLIDRLRERGYLSHALQIDPENPPAWLAATNGGFEPSRAGHSTDRLDALFTALLEKQNDVGGEDDAALVAGVGDDEQFAVAGALIADHLGFDARVAVGARLASDDLPACDEGACRGADLAAWLEVRGTDGAWVALDTTPQSEVALAPDVQDRRDPQNPTEVTPEAADTVLPPEPDPADAGAPDDDERGDDVDWAAVLAALRIAGIALALLVLLLGPFAAVLVAKAVRRSARRGSDDVAERFVGGWEEYVDAATDAGRTAPGSATRTEQAAAFGGGDGARELARWADRSTFAATLPADGEDERFWALVDAERRALLAEGSRWQRVRARLSLRSFGRGAREGVPRRPGRGAAGRAGRRIS